MDYQFTPLTERKIISMDYEEYLKLEKSAIAFNVVIKDIINAKSLDELQLSYKSFLEDVNKGEN